MWGHVERSTDNGLQHLLVTVGYFGETQVCDFDGVVVQEEVGGFDIAMDDVVLVEVEETFENFLDEEVVTLKSCKASH